MNCCRCCCYGFPFLRTIHFSQPPRTIDYYSRRPLQTSICSSEGFLGNAGAYHKQASLRSSESGRLSGIEAWIASARRSFGSRNWKCGMSAMAAVGDEEGGSKTCVQEGSEAKCNLLDDFASRRDCGIDGCLSNDSLINDTDSYCTHVDGDKQHNNLEKLQDEELLRIWQAMTRKNEVPHLVKTLIYNLKALEEEMGESFSHRGPRGRIQGRPGGEEDHRHRASYQAISSSEKKLQFFSARQVACRVLGSKDYLCAKCWLPRQQDCMCEKLETAPLWHGIKFWVYMHPKDFLRKNNTGKLLWQVFGADSVHLCLYGVEEHEASMWNAFSQPGNNSVWCVYPEHDDIPYHVHELSFPQTIIATRNKSKNEDNLVCHFILLDGTWSNSKAMISRLQLEY
ncbi:hypothetical protein O6H91_16G043100 [Diphasiastrum complanatum]|uniref:Uncharacterized protein n=1 Tax=Diphasiastrum complanatum TaxID=34168 RepID=A0ACC2BBS5_DIPCM|nr:hypothetical protein O6H91_16G043100 [Diphasiastrum complanatum]